MTRASGFSSGGLERLRRAMEARVTAGAMPGMVTVLARGDDVRVDGIGTMAFGSAAPMRRDTIFRVTSMTKPILAAAAMALVDEGLLSLDEPVDRLLPELASRRVLRHVDGPLDDTVAAERPITVEDLLTFRMGHGMLTEPTFDPPFPIVLAADRLELGMGPPEPRTPLDPDRWMERFGTLPLMYQPGRRWQYNTGSLVLGVLLSRAGRAPLETVLRSRILAPLDMAGTGFSLPPDHVHRLATQYATSPTTGEVAENTLSGPATWTGSPVFPSGAGGLLSTADDYLAFARMMMNRGDHRGRRVLSARSVELMTTNHLSSEQIADAGVLLSGSGWGYGLAVTVVGDRVSPTPGYYGWSGGYGTTWFNDPHRGLIAIALTQANGFLFNGTLAEFDALAARA